MNVLDENWTPIAGYSHATALLAILQAHDEDEVVDGPGGAGVDSHTPSLEGTYSEQATT